jgi:hypothetical protein
MKRQCARDPLRHHNGPHAERWQRLGEAYLSNSVADEYAVWFLATGLVAGEVRPEGTEKMQPASESAVTNNTKRPDCPRTRPKRRMDAEATP